MKVKVTIGDQVHEVDPSAVQLPDTHEFALYEKGKAPEGFVSTEYMNQELQRRTAGKVKPDDLLDDAEFFKKVAQRHGVALGDDGKPIKPGKDVDVSKLHQTWKSEHLDPVLTENQQLKTSAERLLRRVKLSGLQKAAADAGIKKQFRAAPQQGLPSAVEAMFETAFEYDPETQDFAEIERRDEKGGPVFRYGTNPQERRYAGFKDFFDRLAKNPEFADWFEDPRQRGSGFESNGRGGAQTMRRSQFDGLSHAEQHSFIKGGGQVVE